MKMTNVDTVKTFMGTTTEEIQDIAGAMFTSNTETGITATYQDADGTIDLVVGTLNQNTTGTAATVTGAAQTAITSLGTLTSLAITGDLDIADTGAGAITVGGTTNTYNFPVVINATDAGIAVSDGTKTIGIWGTHGGSSHAGSAVGTRSNHDLAFITNDAKRMVIHSGGSVGIANTTPDSYYANSNQLVVGSGAARQGITIASSTTTIGQLAFADGTSGDARYEGSIVYNHNDNHMELNTNHATAIYIDSAQKVGIGTTSPTEVLDVAGNMALAGTIIHTGDTDTNIAFDTNTINFTTGNITGLQLINGVNYMAGSPTLPSGSAERSYIYHKNVGNTSLHVGNQYGNDAAAIHFETRNTTRMQIDGDGTVQIGNPAVGSAQNLVIMPQGKLYLDAGGDTYIQESAGNVIDITTGGTRRLRVNSDGLIFNTDTAAANALDDYEEGTWTPLIVGTTGSAGTWALSTSGAGNNYTKIGNRVYFHMSRYVTNKGSYSGSTKVTGLPFANNGSTTAIALSLFPDADYPDTRMVVAQITGNAEIQFYDGARADIAHDWADLGTGYYLNCAGTYLTDS
jgi:hypothetical protein